MTITNTTFRSNNLAGGAQLAGSGFIISATILGGLGGANRGPYSSGSQITDNGYNLEDERRRVRAFSPPSTRSWAGPRTGGLSSPEIPLRPLPRSPAINFIPTSSGLCSATDQRGATLPDDSESFCDIGSL